MTSLEVSALFDDTFYCRVIITYCFDVEQFPNKYFFEFIKWQKSAQMKPRWHVQGSKAVGHFFDIDSYFVFRQILAEDIDIWPSFSCRWKIPHSIQTGPREPDISKVRSNLSSAHQIFYQNINLFIWPRNTGTASKIEASCWDANKTSPKWISQPNETLCAINYRNWSHNVARWLQNQDRRTRMVSVATRI